MSSSKKTKRNSPINISSVGTQGNCKLLILDCIRHRDIIAYLKGVAEAQHAFNKDEFIDIFPWNAECTKGDKLYIAVTFKSSDDEDIYKLIHAHNVTSICGWAHVLFTNTDKSLGNQPFAYIHEITASQNRLKYKGIGSGIINKIYQENIDFIQLMPLPSARLFYDAIGFESYTDQIYTIFKTKNKKPTKEYIDSLIRKKQQKLIDEKNEFDETIQEIHDELSPRISKKLASLLKDDIDEIHKLTILDIYENPQATINDIVHYINSSYHNK